MSDIKRIILNNIEEKEFGCIHCAAEKELCIKDISIMENDIAEYVESEKKSLVSFKDTYGGLLIKDNYIDEKAKELVLQFYGITNNQEQAKKCALKDIQNTINAIKDVESWANINSFAEKYALERIDELTKVKQKIINL